MKSKDAFTQLAKRITRSRKGIRDPQTTHPVRDWLIGLLIGVVIFVGSAVWSAKTYSKYRNASFDANSVVVEGGVVYRESLINQVLRDYSARADRLATLQVGLAAETPTPEPEPPEEASTESATSSDDVVLEEDPALEESLEGNEEEPEGFESEVVE